MADKKLTYEEFVKKAIVSLRKEGYKGIHSVYSGFNGAFRDYYGEKADPVQTTRDLARQGKIETIPSKGGAMLYLPGDLKSGSSGRKALEKMGL